MKHPWRNALTEKKSSHRRPLSGISFMQAFSLTRSISFVAKAFDHDYPGVVTQEELSELYRKKGALVHRRCHMLLRDPAEAEDALHEVFARAWKYRNSIHAPIPLAWLYRTAERVCFDKLRKTRRESPALAEDASLAATVSPDDASGRAAVLAFFDTYDDKLKRVALLHYIDGLTQEAIASELNWSRRTVGKKIKLLRERARKLASRYR